MIDILVNYFSQLFWSIVLVNCFGIELKTTPKEFHFDNPVQAERSTG
jgi:hypothetical protein